MGSQTKRTAQANDNNLLVDMKNTQPMAKPSLCAMWDARDE